ncbi:MAG: PucR family transcriptional regulator ligand-binding domain-containing protein [Actinomycetota bacterium]|nr:PucR family transcriptional regulator ligand-binding domain-containing protein [Actinomycetota bacterium]
MRQLTDIPYLRTRIHAGWSGAEGIITWAHSIEGPCPWEWLGEGDLVMTTGLGIPPEPCKQVAYVENLARVGVTGVAIAEDMVAPPLAPEMLSAAEKHGLPLLLTAYEIPFIQISRAVAASSHEQEHTRLIKAVRIYDQVRAAAAENAKPGDLLARVGKELGCRLWICVNELGTSIFADTAPLPKSVQEAFLREVHAHSGPLPGIIRSDLDGAALLIVPVPARRPASLLAVPYTADGPPPFALLQHAATVGALEVERLCASREELHRLGSETFAALVDVRISPDLAVSQLRAHRLGGIQLTVLALSSEGGLQRSSDLHYALAERGIPNLLLRRNDVLYVMLPADESVVAEVLGMFDDQVQIGLSDRFRGLERVAGATREARWALESAVGSGTRVGRYGVETCLFGPRSLAEARAGVDRVLGPLLSYDAAHGTALLASLQSFLRHNRSWQRAAEELYVHKQTLVYRIRRIEELTGRKLNSTGDVAELWLAMQVLNVLE